MNEESISRDLYLAAVEDQAIQILCWQSVDGKGYFAADIKFRLPDKRRIEPDLVIRLDQQVWLIEVKGKHSEAVADEHKLEKLQGVLGDAEVLRQIQLRSGVPQLSSELVLAVAYYGDDLDGSLRVTGNSRCVDSVIHIDWKTVEAAPSADLSEILRALYSGRQRST